MKKAGQFFAGILINACFLISQSYAADLEIGNYSLVSKQRAGRTEYEYTFKANMANSGPDVQNVTANIVSISSNTDVIDGSLTFGNILSGHSIESIDTFVIKVDRRYPFDSSSIEWNIQHSPWSQIKFGNINYSPKSFFYDESTAVTFNAAITTEGGVVITDVTIYETDADGKIIHELVKLYDNGDINNADDIAGDGVYSNKRLFEKNNNSGNIHFFIEASGMNYQTILKEQSDNFGIELLAHLSDDEYAEALEMSNIAQDKYESFLSQHSEEEAKIKSVEWLESQPEIGKAGIAESGYGIWYVLDSGILGGIFLSPEGTKGNVGSNATLGLSPFYDQFQPRDTADGAFKVLQDAECPKYNCSGPIKNSDGTVEAFKSLSKYGIILISTDGDTWFSGIPSWWNPEWGNEDDFVNSMNGQVVIKTATQASDDNIKAYEEDLIKHRLAVTQDGFLAILPSFILHHNGTFPKSLVYMSSCRSLYNDTMADAFLSKGALTYFGYSNYVLVNYAFDVGRTLFESLIEGKTAKEAYDYAVLENAACDVSGACIRMKGDTELTIGGYGIANGDFEEGLTGWNGEGDVRVISKLGPLTPKEGNYMAIISTGLGSIEDSNSKIYQPFCIGPEFTNLSFDYNIISEEPMEWTGSGFDDKFWVYIEMHDGSQITIAQESINTSSWKPVAGIDFYAGDATAFMTDWKHIDIDISSLPDIKSVKFETRTWDVGDSLWDTAALIDNIRLYKK